MNHGESKSVSCPKCGWNDTRVSSHSSVLDYVLAFVAMAPLRCRKCRLRFYRPWFMVNSGTSRAMDVETRTSPQSSPSLVHKTDHAEICVDEICADVEEVLVNSAPPLAFVSQSPSVTPAERPTVLVVDEDEAMRHLLAKLLKQEGYFVRHASGHREATAALAASNIDVVVTNFDEIEQCCAIDQWRSKYPELRIIALSSAVFSAQAPHGNLLRLPLPCPPRALVRSVKLMMEDCGSGTRELTVSAP